MQIVPWVLVFYFWKLRNILSYFWITELPSSLANVLMNLVNFTFTVIRYAKEHISIHLFLTCSDISDYVFSQLDIISIQLTNFSDFAEYPSCWLSFFFLCWNFFPNSLLLIVDECGLDDFGIEVVTTTFVDCVFHDSCYWYVKHNPIICPGCLGFAHLMMLFIKIQGVIFVNPNGP